MNDFGMDNTNMLHTLQGKDLLRTVGAKLFIAMTELSTILSDIISTFYTIIPATAIGGSRQAEVRGFEAQLATWCNHHHEVLYPPTSLFPDPTGKLYLMGYFMCRS